MAEAQALSACMGIKITNGQQGVANKDSVMTFRLTHVPLHTQEDDSAARQRETRIHTCAAPYFTAYTAMCHSH